MNRTALFGLLFASTLTFGQTTSTVPLATPAKEKGKRPDGVVVIGEARSPQVVRYSAEMTISSAISAAGGTVGFSGDVVYLIRNGAVKMRTSQRRLEKDPKNEDVVLLPWDIVSVGPIPVR